MGIAKIDTNKKIEKDAARQVTFSKRRTGLFKKAFELSVLCDLELAIVVFSQKGKVFSFAHPEIHHVIAKYRDAEDVKPFDEQKLQEIHLRVEQLIPLYDHVIEQSKIGKEQNQCLKQLNTKLAQRSWTPVDVETMSLQQLQHHSEELQKLIDYHDAYRQHHQSSFYGGFMHQNPQPHFHLPPPSEPPPQLSQPPQPSQHEDRHGLADPNQQPWPQQWHPAGMPAAMRTMQWQQPSSSNNNDHRNPNFSTGIRPAMGSQNFMYYAPEPTPIQRGNYHGQQPSHSAGVPDDRIQLHRPAMYYDQQQQAQQQEQEQEQQLVTDGDQMASRYLAQSYVHQYEPVDHQNQQSRYTENMQLGRAYNELNSFYSPFMPPAEQQLHPGVYDTQVHGHAYPYNSGAEPAFAHQESFFQEGSSQILLFSLPYDPFAHAPMVPADEAAYRNSVNIGTIRAQSSRDNQAHVACEITGRNDGREVNSGPSSHPSDDSTDSSEALKNKSARCNIGIATGPDTAYNA